LTFSWIADNIQSVGRDLSAVTRDYSSVCQLVMRRIFYSIPFLRLLLFVTLFGLIGFGHCRRFKILAALSSLARVLLRVLRYRWARSSFCSFGEKKHVQSQIEQCEVRIGKCKIECEGPWTREGVPPSHRRWRVSSRQKYLALLAFLALLQETSGNLHVFKDAQGCQWQSWELRNSDCRLRITEEGTRASRDGSRADAADCGGSSEKVWRALREKHDHLARNAGSLEIMD
jgi:hypothetical protein